MADRNKNIMKYEKIVVDETEWKFDYGFYGASHQEVFVCCRCSRQESPNCASCGQNKKCSCGHNHTNCPSCRRRLLLTNPRNVKHSLKMGSIEWNIAFDEQTKKLDFTCQTVTEGAANHVYMELVKYARWKPDESYEKKETTGHLFSRTANSLSINLIWTGLEGKHFIDNLFTIRILKFRSIPDFTLEDTVVGRIRSNGKLRVGDQVFYVNKQFLSMHSEYFDLLYNNDKFKEANQDEIELKHERADPATFHDFLLVMHVAEALPKHKNVAALLDLANIYRVDIVRDKCHRHLWMCREMPVEERYMLAGEHGFTELQTSIKSNADFEERERIIDAVSKKAFALTK